MNIDTLNNFTIKTKFSRANQMTSITKEFSSEIMKRWDWGPSFYKRNQEKKTNFKKKYYQRLDVKNIIDKKEFWKTVKTLLSAKSVSRGKINMTQNEKTLPSAENFNSFFSNIGKKLEIPKFDSNNPITKNIKEPVLKYKNHHSIFTIHKSRKNKYLILKKRELRKSNWKNK